jgi:hypothetical protein
LSCFDHGLVLIINTMPDDPDCDTDTLVDDYDPVEVEVMDDGFGDVEESDKRYLTCIMQMAMHATV